MLDGIEHLGLFVLAGIVLNLTPGVDVLYILTKVWRLISYINPVELEADGNGSTNNLGSATPDHARPRCGLPIGRADRPGPLAVVVSI